jgi:hypothetical protein
VAPEPALAPTDVTQAASVVGHSMPAGHSNHNRVHTFLRVQVLGSHTFRLNLDQPYYPALQELTLIRPARFISPRDLPQQKDQRSCPSNAPLFWPTNVTIYRSVGTCHLPCSCYLLLVIIPIAGALGVQTKGGTLSAARLQTVALRSHATSSRAAT